MTDPGSAVPGDEELRALVSRLNHEQKVRLLTGAGFWTVAAEPAAGLRGMVMSDGPAGVRGQVWDERSTSANLPSPTALAASWDVGLVTRLGELLAAECQHKGVDVLLAPTVNLHRSPYGGRHFECLSEDPLLTGQIGAGIVRGLQAHGVAATVKHFVANDSETDRFSVDVRVTEQVLRELYLYPFEMIVREAGVWAVMAAYNSVDGSTMTQSPLLESILHREWDFDGVIVTDWFAGRSCEQAALGALDLMMPGPSSPWQVGLLEALRAGRVPEAAVDDKVLRLLRLAGRVGALDAALGRPDLSIDVDVASTLREAASSGFVLLRNEPPAQDPDGTPLLPMDRERLTRLAVLGPNAMQGRTLGGGSALVFPPYTVSPLEGLEAALPAVEILTGLGVRAHTRLAVADPELLSYPTGRGRGVHVSFLDEHGDVVATEQRRAAAFNWQGNPLAPAPAPRSIRLDTVLTAPVAGEYTIGTSGVGTFRLSLDKVIAFDAQLSLPPGADFAESLMAPPQQHHAILLAEGQQVAVELLYVPGSPNPDMPEAGFAFQLNLELPYDGDDSEIERAVELASGCDAVVLVVGTTEDVESEGFDRSSLNLPGRQDELIVRVAAVNPRTVVVVNAGAPVLLPWRDRVAAVLLTWFPGQEFGNALSDVLLGVTEPGGRLPTTWPAVEDATLPSTQPVDGVIRYDEGLNIGYRRFLRDGVQPAYWFGHGLGYTRWEYLEAQAVQQGAEVKVTARVRNSGARPGREVVQVYLSRTESAVSRPVRWLAGHAAVSARPGEVVSSEIVLQMRQFAHWDVPSSEWQVEPGVYQLHVGSSAGQTHATIDLTLA